MAMRELKQTHYLDVADANIRHDTRDHRQDMAHYHVPLMRLHQTALHGWGIAVGLEVTQTGPAELTIAEGLAIDAQGRMLPLAAAGHAPGQPGKAFVHTTSPGSLVDVPVVVPMREIDDGTYYVTMELAVTPGPEGPVEGRFLASEGRIVSTPLVRVQPTVSVPPEGQAIILATVTLAEGVITQLHGADRQLAHLATGAVVLRRSAELGADETGPAVGETVGGRLSPLATGGVQVTVPQASDKVVVHREGEHNFQELTVRADQVRVLDGAGRDVMHVEANTATLRLGTQGRAGMLVVQDANGGEALRIDADHEILFPEHGQIRAFDDTHKLVFDRPQNRLELHEQGDIRLLTGAPTPTERVRILATGAVGIGTQTPTQALEVAGTIKATAFQGDGSALTAVRDHTKVSKTGDTMTGPLAIRGAGTSLNITSNARVGGNLTVGDRLGIGTGNPAFQLSLGSSIARTKLALYETGASNSYGLGVTARTFRLHLNGNQARFAFFDNDEENANEIVTIRGTGNVGIGTFAPAVRLHVRGNRLRLEKAGTSQTLDLRADGNALDIESNNADLFINNNNRPVFIRNLQRPSAREWKQDIVELSREEAMQILAHLNPTSFRFKEDESQQRHLGFIADELPASVATSAQKAFSPVAIIAVLTKVVKEQQVKLSIFHEELVMLKNRS